MPKHTCGYLLQLRLIHSILQQATEGFANCVKFAIKLVCVWQRKRGVCLCVYFVYMHTETHRDTFTEKPAWQTHSYTHNDTQAAECWRGQVIWFVSFCYCVWSIWLQPRFAILQKNPATFKEVRNKPRGVSEPALCWRLLQKTVKTLSNWTPVVLHIFVMDNGRLSQSVPSPSLARKRRAGISYLSRKKVLAYSAKS